MNMERRYRPAKVEIDLSALKHNAQLAKRQSNNAYVMTAIKANAYGHGVVPVANALKDVVDEMAVASIDDVLQIRQNSPECGHFPITVLSGFYHADEISVAASQNASLVIYEEQQVRYLLDQDYSGCKILSQKKINIWLKVDTGMNRLGLQIEKFSQIVEQLEEINQINIRGVISHFANADDPDHELNSKQIRNFEKLKSQFQLKQWHWSMANSAAIFALPTTHLDWVRPGIMLYGGSPLVGQTAEQLNLKPVMTFSSEVISLREVKAGKSIGYGSLWTATHDTKVAVVACGYGDGYPRCIQADTSVLVSGERTVILGRVSMDLLVVDVTNIEAEIGSKVVLWGKGLPVEEISQSVGTISYELFCGITERVAREYINA